MQAAIQSHLTDVKSLLRQYGIETAYLFGSAARGSMKTDSDVDILISFPKDTDYVTYADNYFGLLYALQDLFQREVELVTEDTLTNPYFIESINRDKISLL